MAVANLKKVSSSQIFYLLERTGRMAELCKKNSGKIFLRRKSAAEGDLFDCVAVL